MSNFSEEFKRKSFNKIAGLVAENYVDQSLILNNWDNITNRYKRNLINISTLEDFYRYIDNMLLELRDPHTRFKNNNIIKIPSVLLVYINNEIFIAATFYNDSKLKIGSKLLKINGEKIKDLSYKYPGENGFQPQGGSDSGERAWRLCGRDSYRNDDGLHRNRRISSFYSEGT